MIKPKVLLVYPRPSVSSPQKSPPLSILHVGESLRRYGYPVRYVDGRYDKLTEDDFRWADAVGVSSMTGYQLKGAIDALKLAKSFGKRAILGGIHVTMQPEQCLSEPYVDAIVTSEGEHAVLDAIDGGPKHVARGHLHSTAEHVSPVSPETLIHFRRSAVTGDTVLMTSRGCPFRCGFCYIQAFFNRSWQEVDMDRWRHDVLYLKEHAGVVKYEHGDDWIGRWPRAREIIRFLFDNQIEYRPSIRAHQIDDEVAREMASMGIQHLSVGMETASLRMLKLTEKDILPWHQIRCAEALAAHGIWPLYYWITGFPTETAEETNETLDQADRLYAIHQGKVTQNFYAYTALPGSPLYDLVDPATLPKTMAGWADYSLNQTTNEIASNLYHIAGLHFHRGSGDKTDRNFPGTLRELIRPYEDECSRRWKARDFTNFDASKAAIEALLRDASRRYEQHAGGMVPAEVDIADWGVGTPDNRGSFGTGELGHGHHEEDRP
jgi:anaerobic magnesium-protoporphyrin IX monomethyl ester cyclase